ncbi:MAG: head GIN domain-containing protein [Pseudomonadota bacterium]
MNNPIVPRKAKLFGVVSTLAATISLSGCINFDTGFSGVPLDEIDMGSSAPVEFTLAGPDAVFLTVGDTLDIQVEGDPDVVEDLRFNLDGDELSVGRESGWDSADGTAIIRITMPAPREVVVAGSGDIQAATLASKAEVTVAGSGAVTVESISSDDLEATIAGSGSLKGSGSAKTLEISIAGSGDIDFADLNADIVEISIAGSGDVELASDGTVNTSIAGSGDVSVTGNATCNTSAVGSGDVTCRPRLQTADAGDESEDAE